MLIDDALVDEGLELLTEGACWVLLEGAEVGRVGVTIGALPAIFPVNYAAIDRTIVFRTAPGSKLTAASAGAVVAFQVDDYQRSDRSGWSVLAVVPPRRSMTWMSPSRSSPPGSSPGPRASAPKSCA